MSDTSPTPEGAFSQQGPAMKIDLGPSPEEPALVKPAQQQQPFLQRHGITILLAGIVAAFVATVLSVGINVVFVAFAGGRGNRLVQQGKSQGEP